MYLGLVIGFIYLIVILINSVRKLEQHKMKAISNVLRKKRTRCLHIFSQRYMQRKVVFNIPCVVRVKKSSQEY